MNLDYTSIRHLDTDLKKTWPETFEVDHETYANVCQHVFDHIADNVEWGPIYEIALGPNKGLMFKNVELILKK